MARNVYYPYDLEAHKNLSHKQFPIYFMDHEKVHLHLKLLVREILYASKSYV